MFYSVSCRDMCHAWLTVHALNVALLMLEGERANRKGLSQGLSNYYKSSARLAPGVLKKIWECNQPGRGRTRHVHHITINFGSPGIWGYGYTRPNRMVRDRFIVDQRSCGLWRHLDSVRPDTPIREIVNRSHVWESHSEQKRGSSPGTDRHRERLGVSSDSLESTGVLKDSLWVEPQILVCGPEWSCEPQEGGDCAQPRRLSGDTVISDRTAHTGCPGRQSGRGEGTSGHRNVGAAGRAGSGDVGTESSVGGRAGDGVFLVWLDTMLPSGHFVSVSATMVRFQSGNEGWPGWEGQPSGPAVAVGLLTPAEGSVLPRPQETIRYGCHQWGMRMAQVGVPAHRVSNHWGVIRQCFPQGNTCRLTRRRTFWPSRSWDRRIGLFETLRLRWEGV